METIEKEELVMKGLGTFTLVVSAVASTFIIVETCYDMEQKLTGKFYNKLGKAIVGAAGDTKAEEPKAEEAKETKKTSKQKTE